MKTFEDQIAEIAADIHQDIVLRGVHSLPTQAREAVKDAARAPLGPRVGTVENVRLAAMLLLRAMVPRAKPERMGDENWPETRYVWQEDDARPHDRERLDDAWLRLYGERCDLAMAVRVWEESDVTLWEMPNGKFAQSSCSGGAICERRPE